MKIEEKIQELRHRIELEIIPLINHDYRYLMMCDHANVGDTLIMEGEFQFLKTIKQYKCKEYTTMNSFESRCPSIPTEDLLVMRGSGSFGDIWPTAPNFWRFVMKQYPNNPILFMPQTIYFSDTKNLEEMAVLINGHKNVTICVRDEGSYYIAQKYFTCRLHLVPDMAFYICSKPYQIPTKCKDKTLIVKRTDKESKTSNIIEQLICDSDLFVSDWPTIGNVDTFERIRRRLLRKSYYVLYDLFVRYVYRQYIIFQGIKFLAPYNIVYATRMHAGILAMLMGKQVHFVDNNYGKLSRMYNTWLKDVDNIKLDK